MNVSDLIDPSFSYRLIATLMHFLWHGCLVALVTIPADWLLRHAPASRRYALHVTALTIMVACVAVTFLRIEMPDSEPATSAESAAIMPITDMIPPNPGAVDPTDLPQAIPPSFVGVEATFPELPSVAPSIEPVVPQNVRDDHPIVNGDGWREFQRWAPQIAVYYFACCALLLARLARGTWVAHRLRRTATTVSDDSIVAMLHRQSKQLGLRVIPRIAWCAEVSIPLVIGIFKPMILLPAAAATGLSPDQLQALITHELAHICRYDLLVNLLQRIVESMLFFHPAVWYISRRISSEREHACDEMVLATGCERLRYADALVRMAELSTSMRRPGQSAPATSLAAAGANSSEFKRRVLKVLSVPTTSQLRPSRIALLVVLTLILGAALFASRRQYSAHAEIPPSPTDKETKPQDGLEFLKPYPKLHGLSLDMTESQFLEIIKPQDLKSRKTAEAGKVTHRITLGDDHTLVVMFDKDGKCGGIQRVRGEDEVADEPASVLTKPQCKESQSLFQKWQRTARTNGDIPGGAIRPLVRVMTNFVKNNPTHEGSPKFAELLKRIDVMRDWSHVEAVKLLDEVTAIYPSLPEWVEDEPRFTLGGDVVVGKPLPEDLKDAPWGEAQPNGLRAAWLLEPRGNEYRLNTALKSRVLFQNSGKNAVVFRALTWNQSGGHKALDGQGQEININSTSWTTIPRTFACRLAPGEFIEVIGAGIGVGPNKDDEDWRDARSEVRVGSWIEAKVGDDVTFIPAAIDGDGRESARPDDDDTPATPNSWWPKFVKDRLSLDAPLPADANERGRLLDRAVHDLFGNAPTNVELADFKNDTTPGAFDALAKRLAERTGFETFSGMLTSGPTKFKVLPVDPDAAKKPRTAKGPGRYPLGGNTAFVVTRRPIGERIVNEARLDFAPTDATKPAPRESHPVPLPDGYDTWIAAWMRGGTVLWVAQMDADQKKSIRRYDVTNPTTVREIVITELKPGETLPQALLDVLVPLPPADMGAFKPGREWRQKQQSVKKYVAALPSRSEVELAGVAFVPLSDSDATTYSRTYYRKEDAWWSPDGTKLETPPYERFSFACHEEHADYREFAIRLTPPHKDSQITITQVVASPMPQRGNFMGVGWDSNNPGLSFKRATYIAGFEVKKPVAIHVFVSEQPFGPPWKIDLDGKTMPSNDVDATTQSLRNLIKIVRVESLKLDARNDFPTVLRFELPPDYLKRMAYQLMAITKQGESLAPNGHVSGARGYGEAFKRPISDLSHFEIKLRPTTHEVTFENVSLVQGQATEVKVKIEPIDLKVPQQAIGNDPSESADVKKLVQDLTLLLPEHWHPRLVSGRTIQMMPGSYLKTEESPYVVLVFTDDKSRPAMKWERKDGQYEYLGQTPHGHGHLFVSMKIAGDSSYPETMELFDWPDAAEFVKAFLKGDHTKIAALRNRSRTHSTIRRDALASGSATASEPDARTSRPIASRHFTRNGLRYEIEAVAFARVESPGGTTRKDSDWWRADGTNLDVRPANLADITVPKDQANFREFVLRAHVVDEQEIHRHSAGEFWVPPSPGQRFHTSRLAGQDVLRFQLIKRIDVEKPASFALYFTDAPWSVSATLDLNGQLHPNTEMDDKYLSLVKQFEVTIVENLPTKTIVKVHPTSDESRRTLVTLSAIKLDGQATRAIDPTTDELYVINAPSSEIEAFQISLRRMTHKATFENVATLPGQKTEPTVSLEPLDTLVSVTFRKEGKTLGILSDMSVTRLEETLAVLQHDLNSETSELIIETQLATTVAVVERIVKRLNASGWKWPTITVTSASQSEKDIAAINVFVKDFEPFQGNWALDICDSETKDFGAAQNVVRKWRWTIHKNEIKWTRSNGEIWNLSFAVDSTKSPKEIDFTFLNGPHKGEKCLGMFAWGGVNRKMLQISLQDPGAKVARPKSISMTGGGQTSLIFLEPIGTNETEKELASFQGTWCFDVLQIADWPQPIGIGTDSNGRKSEKRMVVKGNQISWTDRQGNGIVAEFTIDPLQTPKQIDLTFLSGPNRGAKSIGIYEPQRGNDAYRWLCMTLPGFDAPRPIDVSASSLKKQSMIGMYQVAPPEKPSNARALERFQGVWNMTLCDSALPTFGATQQEASKWQWTISGDEVLWNRQGEVWKLKLDVDPSKRPREIDLTYLSGPFQGEKCLGMYEFGGVDEQSFNISIQDPGANVPRPKAIEMRGGGKTSLIFLRPAKPSDVERQIGAFQGTWTLRNFDTGKNNDSTSWPLPQGKGPDKSGEGSELRWAVKGNEITWVSRAGQEIKASFTFDAEKRPKQIDLTFLSGPDKGETCPGIYQRGDLDENILWLCMADPKSKSVRPKNFSYQFGEGRSVLSLYQYNPGSSDRDRADTQPRSKPESDSVSSTVAKPKPSANDASRRIPTRDKYSATLPNGDEVELVSVAYAVASQADGVRKRKEVEWWRADGTKLDGTPPFKLSDVWVNADQADFREFAFRLKRSDDIVPLTTLVSWTTRPDRGSGGAMGSEVGFVNLQHVAGFKGQTPVNVHFFYSNLPTQGAGVIDMEGKMPPLPQTDSGNALRKIESLRKLIQIVGVEKNKDETILRFQMPPYHSELMDVNFVAIDVNGIVHGADRWHNTPIGNGKVFKLPAAEISHFDIRLRLMTHKITFENVSLVPGQKTDVRVKVEPIPEGKFGKLPTDTAEISEMEKTVGLDFLKQYPKLNGLSLSMTESQFLEFARQQELKPRKIIDGDKVTQHISLGDGHTLIVMFDEDAKCSGIQRVRGEDAKQHVIEVRLVGGPKSEPLSKVKVEFTSGHGSDQKSFGTFTTDDAGWIRATLPVGFYYLHLSSEQERPYLTFEKFWTGNGQGLSRSLNVRVTESQVEKWLDGKRRESGFEAATKDRPARITFTLEPAVELVLRAIDVETGKGIPGVEFYEEVAAGEDWAHPIYAENIGTKFTYDAAATKEQKNLTDNEGYLRRWISEKTEESKFGAWTMPGYDLIEPKGEISLLVKLGQKRVEQNFKFRRVQQARGEAARADVPRVRTKPALLLPDHWIMQAVGFDDDGKELVTASNQSFITIRRWDVIGMKLISEIKLQADKHGRPFREGTLKFSGDRKRVIGATDAYVGIWEAATGKLLKKLPFRAKEGIYDCAIDKLDCTPDLSVIVGHRALPGRLTLSYDAYVIVWDGVTGNVSQTVIDKGATDLKAIDLSTDGTLLVTTNGNGAKIWETSTGKLIQSISNDNSGVKDTVRSPNQRVIADRSPTIPSQYASHVWSVQLSPDGKQLVIGDILGVKLIDTVSGTLLRRFDGTYRYSSSASPGLVFSKDGQWLARLGTQEEFAADKYRYVVPIWSTRTGARLFDLHTEANDAAFSDDGQRLAVAYSDMQQALAIWSLNGDVANVEQSSGPGPHSRQDRVEENGHYVGKVAAEYIDKFKPSWGEPRRGLQYGIALTKPLRQFRIGERVPLVVFIRNASDKPIKFDTAPDFFGNTPKLLNAKEEKLPFENVALLGHIPHYHETLNPGEALGPFYLSFGLGENPRPGQEHWHPYLKSPAAGAYNLTHSVSINVAGTNPGEADKKDQLISTMIEFEIVE